ncbi:serine hydrolase domain-containing protein [Pseudogracilibacillus sp. SE30717A]|uniref:serine hydrolase domain-containing protein n=1 Tax=Pseudogracilibacillus sp. SE30717A TaxID=3098293 RepID=UPI00300E11C9
MKKFKRFWLLVVFVLFMNTNSTVSALEQKDMEKTIDEFIEEKVNKGNIPNAAVSIVYDGEIIFEKGYGFADIESEIPVDPETSLFRIGSISKLMTWTAVMQLVEQGKLDLDTDVNEYIDFNIPLYGSTPITLRHLLTHTPGFEDYSTEIFTLKENNLPPLTEYVRESLPERIFPAGEVLAYSNYGTALAGYIVEQVSGMPYATYIEENIYKKLAMNNSTFDQPLPQSLSEYSVTPYRFVDGKFREADFEFLPVPAGAMSSSASDMAHFMIAYLQNGYFKDEKILEEKTVQEMFNQQFTHHPALDGMALGFIEGTFNEKKVLFHHGGTMMFNSSLYLLPEEGVGIFMSYSGGNHLVHNEVFQGFMDQYFPMEEEVFAPSEEGTNGSSEKFAGEYHQNRRSLTTVDKFISLVTGIIQVETDKDGYLYATHAGETNQFYEIEPGVFKNKRTERTPDAYGNFKTIVFEKDKNGNMMLMTDGPMTYAKAPWYASSGFTFVALALSILLLIGTLLSWTIVAVIRILRKKQKEKDKITKSAKLLAIGYGALSLLFFGSIAINGEIDPVYQMPKDAFSELPEWSIIFDFIPYLIIAFSIALTVFTIIIWKRRSWRVFGRIHYSLYTSTTLFFVWLFSYWNLF